MCVKRDSDSVLQWVCPERCFKRGAEARWAGTPCAVALLAKGKDLKHGLLPLNIGGQTDQKGARQGGFLSPGLAQLSGPEAAQSAEFRTLHSAVCAARTVGCELDRQELNT